VQPHPVSYSVRVIFRARRVTVMVRVRVHCHKNLASYCVVLPVNAVYDFIIYFQMKFFLLHINN